MQQALSSKVLNTAKDGGGFLQAVTAYLTDEAFRSSKPKVLIWEVPERFLMTKLEDEPKWLAKVKLSP
jgi:alginate O-acetyltransferase complex protein AlgJ